MDFLIYLVINYTVPFLSFSQLIQNAEVILKHSPWIFLSLSLLIFVIGGILGYVFSFNKDYGFKREFVSMVGFQNCGYLPMNLTLFLLPPHHREEFLVYIFLYVLGFNIILWSVGSFFIFKKKGDNFQYKSLFTPPVMSAVLALILVYTNIYHCIPSLILEPLKMIGEISFVLSMIILGCWLAKINLSGMLRRLFIIGEVSFLKLILLPFIFLLGVINFKIFSLIGLFIILQASMPSSVTLPIVVNLKGADSEFVSQGVFITHIISIFTIPFWLGIFLNVSGLSF